MSHVPLLDPDTGKFPARFYPDDVAQTVAETVLQVGSFLQVDRTDVSGNIDLAAVCLNGGVYRQAMINYKFTGNVTVTTLPPTADVPTGFTIALRIKQDATGGRLLTLNKTSVSYGAQGTPVLIDLTPDAVSLVYIQLFKDATTSDKWDAVVAGSQLAVPTAWVV